MQFIASYQVPKENAGTVRTFRVDNDTDLASDTHTMAVPGLCPDISLVGSRTKLGAQPTHWRDRVAFVEVKASEDQGPTSPNDTVKEIAQQAADHARLHMSLAPFQLFSVGLLIYGLQFCVAIFDRAGVTFSPEGCLDTTIGQGWYTFIRIVRCLAVTATPTQLGLDPTATPISPSPTVASMIAKTAQRYRVVVPSDLPVYAVSLGGLTERRWVTVGPLSSSSSLFGRGTTVWLVGELDGDVPTGKVAAMKTSWRRVSRTPESAIYQALKSTTSLPPYVANFLEGADVEYPFAASESGDCRAIRISTLRNTPLGEEDSILHRLFLASVGRPIWMFDSEKELILGLKAALHGEPSSCAVSLARKLILVRRP